MAESLRERGSRLCGAWVGFVYRRAGPVLLLSVALAVLAAWYAATSLGINTSNDDMLSSDLPFRQDSIRYDREFPQTTGNIVIVLDGATVDQSDIAADRLTEALRERPRLFSAVFDPAGMEFFRRNGFLYLDEDELADLIDRLAGAQAFLGTLWRDPSLRGLFGVLGLALENAGDASPPAALGRVMARIAAVVEAQNAGRPAILSWREMIDGRTADEAARRRVILVRPALDESSLQPAGDAIEAIRTLAQQMDITPANGVRLRLTGTAALEEEELRSVAEGMGLAGLISAVLVLVLLLWGLRSPWLVAAMLATLAIGLVWTAGFATLTVGRLNLISVAFAVLFIGLSVDFGIHFTLRLREELDSGTTPAAAFSGAGRGVGGALTLCAVAAAIAFYSFLPTDYVGLAELGAIAGSGMFIALIANLTVLPALIALFPPRPRHLPPSSASGAGWIARHARPVAIGAGVLALGAAALAPAVRFDFDPLNLRDPSTESVSTLFDLMEGEEAGPYSIDVLVDDPDRARTMVAALEDLPVVKSVISADQFIPADQDSRLAIIEQAAFLILPSLSGEPIAPPTPAARATALSDFRATLDRYLQSAPQDAASRDSAVRLAAALGRFQATPEALAELERRLLGTLRPRLEALQQAFEAQPVTRDDIPLPLLRRYVSESGIIRLEVYPKEDVRDPAAMNRFVAAVRTVAPRATGSPVIIVEAGRTVIGAFAEAAAISVLAIAILVWLILRRIRDVALVFAPLALAALLTVAVSVLSGLAFNFANVIVLPLLFGLGVASAIHLVLRERRGAGLDALFGTSTPRAVVFSALTTIGSFASIALSSHPGTASMGILLAVAIALTLVCTLVVLPALMALLNRNGRG